MPKLSVTEISSTLATSGLVEMCTWQEAMAADCPDPPDWPSGSGFSTSSLQLMEYIGELQNDYMMYAKDIFFISNYIYKNYSAYSKSLQHIVFLFYRKATYEFDLLILVN